MASNPARLVRPRAEDNGRIRFLSPDEETRLTAAIEGVCPERLPDFIIALYTGMRASEQYGLTWHNVDFSNKVVSILRTKHGGSRHVSLCDRALLSFEQIHMQTGSVDGLVFCAPDGSAHRNGRRWFEKAVVLSGIAPGFTWHCLRHTFASRLMMAGENVRTVQDAMGHLTIGMTMRYAHLAPDVARKAVQRMEEWSKQQIADFTSTKTGTDTEAAKSAGSPRVM